MPLAGRRATLFGTVLLQALAQYHYQRLRHHCPLPLHVRAAWLHAASKLALRRIGISVASDGTPPLDGLVVSNHLSYLDVLVYASLVPCVFVAKQEVSRWPVFGSFAKMAGTIYVDRGRRADNGDAVSLIDEALRMQVPVVLFPEGTSSDGSSVLPFHSPFFEPAIRAQAPICASALTYSSPTAAQHELAYYGDDVFGPHLLRTLGQSNIRVQVSFAAEPKRYPDRKQAARNTHQQVAAMLLKLSANAHEPLLSEVRSGDSWHKLRPHPQGN